MVTMSTDYGPYAQARRRPQKDQQRGGLSAGAGGGGISTSGVEAKVVVMGNAGVGKTSLVQRYTTNSFNSTKTAATAGAAFHVKKTVVNGVTVRLQLWDTAGQERFRSLAPMYYRGTHAAILVYDITNPSSFEDVKVWLEELKKNVPPETENDMIVYIVGTKVDLAYKERKVRPDRARLRLAQWFPPPRAPTPPPSIKSHTGAAFLYQGGSLVPPENQLTAHFSIPSQISSLSTSMSGHLPTMPSFSLSIPQLDRIRPRFTSFGAATATKPTPPSGSHVVRFDDSTGESPTGTDSTGITATSTTETGGTGSPSSGFSQPHAPPPPAPSTGSRFAFPRSHTTSAVPDMSNIGLNVNLSGSGYSGFTRGTSNMAVSTGSTNAFPMSGSRLNDVGGGASTVEFLRPPGLVRRSTTAAMQGPNPLGGSSSGIKSSKSISGARTRTLSRLSDDERERERAEKKRERDRRPAAYRRFDEVARGRHGAGGTAAGDDSNSSSGDDLARRSGLVRSRSKREVEAKSRGDERRRLEERGCMSDPEGGAGAGGLDEDSDDDALDENQPWGLSQELKLCEVSAKDGQGVEDLFTDLLQMIIARREVIEKERLVRERDSVMLNVPSRVPTWGAPGEEDEDDDDQAGGPRAARKTGGWWSWCGI
ncbi:hypothetical protein FRB95_012252 [Tulasnella sp. JGI-2019a]|nr:hypothetical protein FRB95_012252 [Tulasnella sp. JGI-2019a]